MAIPSVFVSSTWYDLRYIRTNLSYFVRTLGYNPVLFEEGAVYFDPASPVQDAALAEVEHCHLFVLVIGGRYGAELSDSPYSVTNGEYETAVRTKIPVFALVERGTYGDYRLYRANKAEALEGLVFPNADDVRIFDFIRDVETNAVNNALVPFSDFADIETYLRQQWAGMLHSFLTRSQADAKVADTLGLLTKVSERVDIVAQLILDSVGSPAAKAGAALYDRMLASEAVRTLTYWRVRPTPRDILEAKTLTDCAARLGIQVNVEESDEDMVGSRGLISLAKLEDDDDDYAELRSDLDGIMHRFGVKVSDLPTEVAMGPSGAE